jgi:uncharacterized protein (DUF1501 family)
VIPVLDPDISTEDALHLLSAPDVDDDAAGPGGWTRRRFLHAVGLGLVGGAALATIDDVLGGVPDAWAAPLGATDGVLVVVTLYGGVDGLNVVVPYTDGAYQTARGGVAVPTAQVLQINGEVGLHPALATVRARYGAGQVAIVQGVGYSSPDLSHFTSMGIWMTGAHSAGGGTGWLGRWLDGLSGTKAALAAASIDPTVPLHVQGAVHRAVGIPTGGDMFGAGTTATEKRMFSTLSSMSAASAFRGDLFDAYTSTLTAQLDLGAKVGAAGLNTSLTGGEATKKLTFAARLLNADLGLRVLDVGVNGYDTHENQATALQARLADLDAGLAAFQSTLSPALRDRVTIVVLSEFGRTVKANASAGTDHGTTNPMFVIGDRVRGGLYGQRPSLTSLDRNGRMISSVDFRSVYGSVIDGWMGGGGSTIVKGSFERLDLFTGGPGSIAAPPAPPTTVITPTTTAPSTPTTTPAVPPPSGAPADTGTVPGGFVPMSPVRVFDTRTGTGGRATAVAAGETWEFSFPAATVPVDATAVVINLTAAEATLPTFVSAWPAGVERPFTAVLNPTPGKPVPNLAVVRLGDGGAINLYNNSGAVHLVGDLVGYFVPDAPLRLRPMSPTRLLDTRDNGGAPLSGSLELVVAGVKGVPADTTAVALNVTVTQPTDAAFLTVWPAGEALPYASNLNMVRGQTVANMVIARLGAGGAVSVAVNAGATHVVVDVVGAFSPSAADRFVAVTPRRVLDTRDGTGTPAARTGRTPISVTMAGARGLPRTGIDAVLLNLTAVSPDTETHVTAYPSGTPVPLASNLNLGARQVVPNLVLCTLGADGAISLRNNSGSVDLVGDVVGYFAPG